MKILMPAYTVAPWGGLHENVISAASALKHTGYDVTMVLRPGLVSDRARELGIDVVEVDWDDWVAVADDIRRRFDYDIILAQPQKSREFALYINRSHNADVFIMFHGFFSDFAYTWSKEVEGFLTVTPALTEFLVDFCKVEPWRVHMVPNGVPSDRFAKRMIPLQEKIANGFGTVVLASRIDKDKTSQVDALGRLITCLEQDERDIIWKIQVLGDGPERSKVERIAGRLISNPDKIQIEFVGWVDSEVVPQIMSDAVFTIAAGRGAMQSLAVGTPCLAAGKHGIAGFQRGTNLRVGLWSNFGDYPMKNSPIRPLEDDYMLLMNETYYAETQQVGRDTIAAERSQELTDVLLRSALRK